MGGDRTEISGPPGTNSESDAEASVGRMEKYVVRQQRQGCLPTVGTSRDEPVTVALGKLSTAAHLVVLNHLTPFSVSMLAAVGTGG